MLQTVNSVLLKTGLESGLHSVTDTRLPPFQGAAVAASCVVSCCSYFQFFQPKLSCEDTRVSLHHSVQL